jgi:hypothetical protein
MIVFGVERIRLSGPAKIINDQIFTALFTKMKKWQRAET